MTDINTAFCRHLLTSAHQNIRHAFPGVRVASRDTIGCVGPHGKDQYFVEISIPGYPAFNNYYSADNAYHAKAAAWFAFFDKYAPEQIKSQVYGEPQ